MADFDQAVPEIRTDFDALEVEFLSMAASVIKGGLTEKKEFTDYCFKKAQGATEAWISQMSSRKNLIFADADYAGMWRKYNNMSGLEGMPA